MARRLLIFLAVLLWLPLVSAGAQLDEPMLELRLRRTFGYQSGIRIQGRFTLEAISEQGLAEVTYLIDDQILAQVTQPSFRISFSTADYLPGEHTLRAEAVLVNGDRIESRPITAIFITAEEGWQEAGRIAGWILGGVVVVMVFGTLGVNLFTRGKGRFELGVYGPAGGAVCRRCEMPFSRHVFSPNLLVGKLERCPHCGRIAIVSRANRIDLEVAEERYQEDRDRGQRQSSGEEERKYQQMLDDSRFEG